MVKSVDKLCKKKKEKQTRSNKTEIRYYEDRDPAVKGNLISHCKESN